MLRTRGIKMKSMRHPTRLARAVEGIPLAKEIEVFKRVLRHVAGTARSEGRRSGEAQRLPIRPRYLLYRNDEWMAVGPGQAQGRVKAMLPPEHHQGWAVICAAAGIVRGRRRPGWTRQRPPSLHMLL